MKTMLNLKQGDLIAQLLAFFTPFIIGVFLRDISCLLICYLSVGAVQVLSTLTNLALSKRYRDAGRRNYEIALGVVALVTVLAIAFKELTLVLGVALLVFSPFMAAYYFKITYNEMLFVKRYAERNRYIMTN